MSFHVEPPPLPRSHRRRIRSCLVRRRPRPVAPPMSIVDLLNVPRFRDPQLSPAGRASFTPAPKPTGRAADERRRTSGGRRSRADSRCSSPAAPKARTRRDGRPTARPSRSPPSAATTSLPQLYLLPAGRRRSQSADDPRQRGIGADVDARRRRHLFQGR